MLQFIQQKACSISFCIFPAVIVQSLFMDKANNIYLNPYVWRENCKAALVLKCDSWCHIIHVSQISKHNKKT